jgi:predicted transcriptional regulator
MADLQTEIFRKVLPKMKLNELKFDDDINATVEVTVEEDTTNQTEIIWRFIRDNPGCAARDVAANKAIPDYKNVATRINQLVKRGLVTQDKEAFPIKNYVVGDEYPKCSQEDKLKKMRAARQKNLASPSKTKKKNKVGRPLKVIKKPQEAKANILDTMSVVEARALYDQLKKIFGG